LNFELQEAIGCPNGVVQRAIRDDTVHVVLDWLSSSYDLLGYTRSNSDDSIFSSPLSLTK
jgi:hypothetical protein